jgi:hypothetical protein
MTATSPTRDRLLRLAEAYANARGLSLARVSTLAANDGKVLGRLQIGRDCTLSTYDQMLAWFSANWPAELAWPEGVERPSIGRAA